MPHHSAHSIHRLAILLVVFMACVSLSSSAETGYTQAIQEAEAELREQEHGNQASTGGWGVSEYISVIALVAAIALMVWVTRFTRRSSWRKTGGREIRLLDRMQIGRESTLLLVRLRGRDYWLAESPGGVSLLAELPTEPVTPVDKNSQSIEAAHDKRS